MKKTNFSFKNISDYLVWVIKQYHEYNQHNYLYKIVGTERCKNTDEEKLIIQIAGKNVFPRLSPKELMLDETTLRGFSPLDVRTITYLACRDSKTGQKENPKEDKKGFFRICMQAFSKQLKKEMVVLEQVGKAELITRSVQEVTRDKSLLRGMNPVEANRIGYIAGYEQASLENDKLTD